MADPKKDQDLEDVELSPNEGVDKKDLENTPVNEDDREEEAADPARMPADEEEPKAEEQPVAAGPVRDEDFEDLPEDNSTQPKEHTLDDLAEEEEPVSPGRPKSFDMDEEETGFAASQIPSSGLYSSDRGFNRRGQGSSRNKGKMLALLLIALLVIGGAVYLLKFRKNSSQEQASQSTPSVSQTPSPSASPSFDRSKFSVRVLNGTSKSGLAASVSAKLTSLGYRADKVGNASNSAFTQTQVRAKSSLGALIDQLIKDLSPDFSAASSSASLKDTDSADAEVILGAK